MPLGSAWRDLSASGRPGGGAVTGAPRIDRVIPFGTGRSARRSAMGVQDALRGQGTPARALFKLEHGGWVVVVYHGRLPERAGGRADAD